MNKSSTWTALRNPAFRKLWIATVISGTCVAAHDIAATSMGAGSVVIIPWLRARLSPNRLILLANLLLVLVYVLMASVRQTEVFFAVAALAGVGWTLSASELWVAAQRAMPSWARGRMNATVIMISHGAMALGGSDLGFGCLNSRSTLHVARSRGSVPHEPASDPSAFNQCCKKLVEPFCYWGVSGSPRGSGCYWLLGGSPLLIYFV